MKKRPSEGDAAGGVEAAQEEREKMRREVKRRSEFGGFDRVMETLETVAYE